MRPLSACLCLVTACAADTDAPPAADLPSPPDHDTSDAVYAGETLVSAPVVLADGLASPRDVVVDSEGVVYVLTESPECSDAILQIHYAGEHRVLAEGFSGTSSLDLHDGALYWATRQHRSAGCPEGGVRRLTLETGECEMVLEQADVESVSATDDGVFASGATFVGQLENGHLVSIWESTARVYAMDAHSGRVAWAPGSQILVALPGATPVQVASYENGVSALHHGSTAVFWAETCDREASDCKDSVVKRVALGGTQTPEVLWNGSAGNRVTSMRGQGDDLVFGTYGYGQNWVLHYGGSGQPRVIAGGSALSGVFVRAPAIFWVDSTASSVSCTEL